MVALYHSNRVMCFNWYSLYTNSYNSGVLLEFLTDEVLSGVIGN